MKVSIWAILKDSIGKDITKMAVPVYFNEPLNLLQKAAQYNEYTSILDKACQEQDQAKRLALVSIFATTGLTSIERANTKPFNPMLGETYELVEEDKEFIAEQVSHHPPISASYCRGLKQNWAIWTNHKTNSKFTGKYLEFYQQYRIYIELKDFGETYEV